MKSKNRGRSCFYYPLSCTKAKYRNKKTMETDKHGKKKHYNVAKRVFGSIIRRFLKSLQIPDRDIASVSWKPLDTLSVKMVRYQKKEMLQSFETQQRTTTRVTAGYQPLNLGGLKRTCPCANCWPRQQWSLQPRQLIEARPGVTGESPTATWLPVSPPLPGWSWWQKTEHGAMTHEPRRCLCGGRWQQRGEVMLSCWWGESRWPKAKVVVAEEIHKKNKIKSGWVCVCLSLSSQTYICIYIVFFFLRWIRQPGLYLSVKWSSTSDRGIQL